MGECGKLPAGSGCFADVARRCEERPFMSEPMRRKAGEMSLERDVARDRDHLIDRLQHLRAIVPVFAQELASARRQAAQLRVENGRLLAEVRRLQRQSGAAEGTRAGKLAAVVKHDANISPPRHAPLQRVAARTPLEPVSVISSLDAAGALGPLAELAT